MARSKSKTIEKVEIKFPDRFNVYLMNDDFTPMDFVIQLLVELFDKTLDEAKEVMLTVHNNGKGLAGSYNQEIAEQKVHEGTMLSRHHGHPLKIVMEKMI